MNVALSDTEAGWWPILGKKHYPLTASAAFHFLNAAANSISLLTGERSCSTSFLFLFYSLSIHNEVQLECHSNTIYIADAFYFYCTFYCIFCFQLKSHAFCFSCSQAALVWKHQTAIYTTLGFAVSRRVYWICPFVWGMQAPDYSSSIWTSFLISTAPTQCGRPQYYSWQGERDRQTGSDRRRLGIPSQDGVDFLGLAVTWSRQPLERPEVCGLPKNVPLTGKGITRAPEFPPFFFPPSPSPLLHKRDTGAAQLIIVIILGQVKVSSYFQVLLWQTPVGISSWTIST